MEEKWVNIVEAAKIVGTTPKQIQKLGWQNKIKRRRNKDGHPEYETVTLLEYKKQAGKRIGARNKRKRIPSSFQPVGRSTVAQWDQTPRKPSTIEEEFLHVKFKSCTVRLLVKGAINQKELETVVKMIQLIEF